MDSSLIRTDRIKVEVERVCKLISEANVYTMDTYHDDETNMTQMFLWDLDTDTFLIGYGFYRRVDRNGYDDLAFRWIDTSFKDKSDAMKTWLMVKKEEQWEKRACQPC